MKGWRARGKKERKRRSRPPPPPFCIWPLKTTSFLASFLLVFHLFSPFSSDAVVTHRHKNASDENVTEKTHLPRGDFTPRLGLFDRDGDDVADAPALAALVDALGDLRAGVVTDVELRGVGDH